MDDSGNRVSCVCLGNLCNGNDWKKFHVQSMKPATTAKRNWWSLGKDTASNELNWGASSKENVDPKVNKAAKKMELRGKNEKSLFSRVFWWWKSSNE
jgi:hypothetical protein